MAGPPADVQASDLWTRLSQCERPTKEVDFPRKTEDGTVIGKVLVRVLTEAELMSSRAAAEDYARKMLKDIGGMRQGERSIGYDMIYQQALFVEVLWRACRDKEHHQMHACPSSKAMREWLTADEIAVLMDAYTAWQLESGPIISHMTVAEMDAWIEKLGEAESAVPLALLSSEAKNDLLLRSALRLRSSSTGSTSAGGRQGQPYSDMNTSPLPNALPNPANVDDEKPAPAESD